MNGGCILGRENIELVEVVVNISSLGYDSVRWHRLLGPDSYLGSFLVYVESGGDITWFVRCNWRRGGEYHG